MKFIVLATLAACASALTHAKPKKPALRKSVARTKTETEAKTETKHKSHGKLSLARLNYEEFQDVDRSGQPITGEVANILAALPNRQLDTNFLSNLM